MEILKNLDLNINNLKEAISSFDIEIIDVSIAKRKGKIVFISDIVDKKQLGEQILKPLSFFSQKITENSILNCLLSPKKESLFLISEASEKLVNGNAVLFIDKINCAFSCDIVKPENRAITEPPTSTVIKGPREGFTESLPININLIRKKLRTPKLTFEKICVGKYSNTPIAICYIKGIVNRQLVKEIKQRISEINTDAILDSSYISKFLSEKNTNLFKKVGNTEKPDILASKILEGRVAILVDGSPIALTAPYLLLEDFQSPSDYYSSPYSATIARLIRLISVSISVLLPALFVSSELFHIQLIPLSFLLTIVNSIKGIPLSPSYEMFFTLLIFEILNEASVRMPKYVGMVVSIVGGLVLGETAVNAGIISAPTLMIIALSGICLYTVPELVQTFSFIRFILLIVAGSFGGYGTLVACSLFIVYLVTFESFETPICAPYSPLLVKDLKDGIYKGFMPEMASRPLSLERRNKTRTNYKENK